MFLFHVVCFVLNNLASSTHFRNPQPPPQRVFTDVTLVCKDGKPPAAHNGILTSTSPFFMNILKRTSILIHLQSSHSPLHSKLSVAWKGFQEMASHCIHFAGQNLHCQSMTWPIMTNVQAHFPLHNVWKDHLRRRQTGVARKAPSMKWRISEV